MASGALHVLRTTPHEVTTMGVTGLDLAIAGDTKPLFGSAMGLHFGHLMILLLYIEGGRACPKASAREGGLIPPALLESKEYLFSTYTPSIFRGQLSFRLFVGQPRNRQSHQAVVVKVPCIWVRLLLCLPQRFTIG